MTTGSLKMTTSMTTKDDRDPAQMTTDDDF